MMRKLFGTLAAACLALALLPATALAADEALPGWVDASGNVTAASITLTGDVDLNDKDLTIGQNVTLDLAGYTLTLKTLTVNSSCSLTLTDSSEAETGTIVIHGYSANFVHYVVNVNGILYANGGTIKLTADVDPSGNLLAVNSGGSIQRSGTTPTTFDIRANLCGGNIAGGVFKNYVNVDKVGGTISGGTFEYRVQTGFYHRYEPTSVTLDINGGTFKHEVWAVYGNTININGGTLEDKVVCEGNDSTLNIHCGVFEKELRIGDGGEVTISHGTFYSINGSYTVADGSHKITFFKETSDSASYATEVVAGGKTTTEPREPKKAHFIFEDWLDESGAPYVFGSTLTADVTLHANWTPAPTATVTKVPKAKTDLVIGSFDGHLVTPGTAEGGKMVYIAKDGNGNAYYPYTYSEDTPYGPSAGTHYIYYKVVADDDHTDSAEYGPIEVTVAPKKVTISGITAKNKVYDGTTDVELEYDWRDVTIEGLVYNENIYVDTVEGAFADADAGEGKTIVISKLTLGGDNPKDYVFDIAVTADITKKAVTLQSAGASKAYDGTALTNETVTATGMAAGEEFDYDFTGTQTGIGSSENQFTAKDSDTAKASNYDITYDYGTLTVSLPANVGDAVKDMTTDTVTSDDREAVEATQKTAEDYLSMEPTEAERAALDDLKAKTEGLIQRLDEVKAAMEDEVVTGTDGITKDNVKIADKKALTDAKAAIEKLLEDYSGNLAAAEKQQLNDKLERIGAALDEIARLERAAEDDAADEIARTGDAAHAAPWLALLFAAGGVMAAAAARVGRSARTR